MLALSRAYTGIKQSRISDEAAVRGELFGLPPDSPSASPPPRELTLIQVPRFYRQRPDQGFQALGEGGRFEGQLALLAAEGQ